MEINYNVEKYINEKYLKIKDLVIFIQNNNNNNKIVTKKLVELENLFDCSFIVCCDIKTMKKVQELLCSIAFALNHKEKKI